MDASSSREWWLEVDDDAGCLSRACAGAGASAVIAPCRISRIDPAEGAATKQTLNNIMRCAEIIIIARDQVLMAGDGGSKPQP
jgi:hypothetical protein